MKSVKTSVASGCIIWVLLIGILSSCIVPVFLFVGTLTSFTEFAVKTMGSFLCPPETSPVRYSYQTTTRDEFGNSQPATAYELQCVESTGEVVKRDPVVYAFIWDGAFAGIGLLAALGLAFLLAAPAGALIAKALNRNKAHTPAIQPE